MLAMKQTYSSTGSRWFDNRAGRLALFAGTGVLAIFATGAIVDPSIPRILIGAIFAPWGLAFLFSVLSSNAATVPSLWAGWLIYFGLAIGGTLTHNRRVWVTLFAIFVTLVLLNMGGCVAYCHTNSPSGNCFYFSVG